MDTHPSGTWPPTHDAQELAEQIRRLTGTPDFESEFYGSKRDGHPEWCQGDVIELESRIPMIGPDGKPTTDAAETKWWLLLGNSCDMDRDLDEHPETHMVPVRRYDEDAADLTRVTADFRHFRPYKTFYLPCWSASMTGLYAADFTNPVTVSREGLRHARLCARMRQWSWVLLYSCVVRFLARGDGRNA